MRPRKETLLKALDGGVHLFYPRAEEMRDFTRIQAWKLTDDLTVALYEATRVFPKEELYGLTSQIRRAAYSVPANIAEGASRGSKRDYLHFLYIARGSLSETLYFIHLAQRLGYLDTDDGESLTAQAKNAVACLQGLIKAVERESGKQENTSPESDQESETGD